MSKIIVLQGVPASGKSTWAKCFIKDHKDYVIVCRDSIREASGIYWVPERERYISCVERDSVVDAITEGLNVIIDAVNLNPRTIDKWMSIAETYSCDIEFKKFNVTLDDAIGRDRARGKAGGRCVGEEVIKGFFEKYYPECIKK